MPPRGHPENGATDGADPAAGLLDGLLTAAGVGAILSDPDGRIRWLAPVLARWWGLARHRWHGRSRESLCAHGELADWLGPLMAAEAVPGRRGPVYGAVGDRRFRAIRAPAAGFPPGWEWLAVVEVTAESRRLQRLERQALRDELTGLANRRCFRERLAAAVNGARRRGAPVSLAYLDLDDFKGVNDRFGHAAGDHALARVGELLRSGVRREDTAARLGGEEFALLFVHAEPKGAWRRAEALRSRLASHPLDPCGGALTASIGVAGGHPGLWAEAEDAGAERLMRAADRALYAAKAEGKNRVRRGPVEPDDFGGTAEPGGIRRPP